MEHVDSYLAADGIELPSDLLDRIDQIVPPAVTINVADNMWNTGAQCGFSAPVGPARHTCRLSLSRVVRAWRDSLGRASRTIAGSRVHKSVHASIRAGCNAALRLSA